MIQREIKFRAWDIMSRDMKSWNYVKSQLEFSNFQSQILPMQHANDFERQFILMQYIGLKDKNGKEIYEGDIIFAESDLEGKAGNLIVVYNPEYVGFTLSNAKQTDGALLMNVQYWGEVLGNIYRNPELLSENGIISPTKTPEA